MNIICIATMATIITLLFIFAWAYAKEREREHWERFVEENNRRNARPGCTIITGRFEA